MSERTTTDPPITMHDHAVAFVEYHRAACTNPTCGCSLADTDEMIATIIERWLSDE